MTESIEKMKEEIRNVLKDIPADTKAYILLSTLEEDLEPVHKELETKEDSYSMFVKKQVKLIINFCRAIIELLDIRAVKEK